MTDAPESAPVPASQPALPPPPAASRWNFGLALRAFFRAVFRLLLILIVGSLIGVGVYLGVPALYQMFIQPVERNTAQIADLQRQQDELNNLLDERLLDLQQRLESLELSNDSLRQTLDELQTSAATDSADLATAYEALAELETGLAGLQTDLAEVNTTLQRLERRSLQSQSELAALQQGLTATPAPTELAGVPALEAVQRDLQVLRAMERLTRARLYLLANNPGLALEQVNAAAEILAALDSGLTEAQATTLAAIQARLDLARLSLVNTPLVAAEDLEAAWQLLAAFSFSAEPLNPNPVLDSAAPQALTGTPAPGGQAPSTGTPTPTATPTP